MNSSVMNPSFKKTSWGVKFVVSCEEESSRRLLGELNSWSLVRRRALLLGGCHLFPASEARERRFFYLNLVLDVLEGTIVINLTIRIGYFDNQN